MHASHAERDQPRTSPAPSPARARNEEARARRTRERLVAAWLRSLTPKRR